MSAILFTGQCDFRCPFCHNASLVLDPGSQPVLDMAEVMDFLRKRRNMLDGVVITGGEPTIHNGLDDIIAEIKALGYRVKLDTNGSRPAVLERLVSKGLVDYVAMDIKNDKEHYAQTIGLPSFDLLPIEESVDFLKGGVVDYEFRTTVVKGLHYKEHFEHICSWIAPCRRYFLQSFVPSGDTISQGLEAPSRDDMVSYLELVRTYIADAQLRDMK